MHPPQCLHMGSACARGGESFSRGASSNRGAGLDNLSFGIDCYRHPHRERNPNATHPIFCQICATANILTQPFPSLSLLLPSLVRAAPTTPNITRRAFLDVLYNTRLFVMEDLPIGPGPLFFSPSHRTSLGCLGPSGCPFGVLRYSTGGRDSPRPWIGGGVGGWVPTRPFGLKHPPGPTVQPVVPGLRGRPVRLQLRAQGPRGPRWQRRAAVGCRRGLLLLHIVLLRVFDYRFIVMM